ncbi:MAG: TonB family protein [Bacteroidales bacterium]|nr:TonB family protein [Bacteroidales bacterium]
MKSYQNKKSWLERNRIYFLEIGMIIVLFLVLLAFEWKTNINQKHFFKGPQITIDATSLPKPTPPDQPKVKEQKKISTLLKIVDDEIDTDNDMKQLFTGWDEDENWDDTSFEVKLKPEKREVDKVIDVPSQMPQYPGGKEEMHRYLQKNTKYPSKAKDVGIEGKVYVEFIVEKDGRITNLIIKRGPDQSLKEEALRVIKNMPNWEPGYQGIHKARVRLVLPIEFKLAD